VIYCSSRILVPTHCNYATTEKEIYAVVFAVEKFRPNLLGGKVIVLY